MITMAEETQDPTASPDASDPGSSVPAKVAELEAQIEGSRVAATDEGEGARRQAADPLTGEVLVPWGDTTRTVKVEDLVQAAMERDRLAQLKEHVDSQMEDMATLRQLGERIEGMTPDQVQALQRFLQDPSSLTAQPNGEPRKESNVGDDLDELLTGQKSTDPTIKNLTDTVAKQQRTLDAIAQYLEGDLAQKKSASLADRVQTEMDSFPVFKEAPGVDGFAKKSILNAIAANPRADMSTVVADTAAQLHKMIESSREGVVAERVGPRAASPRPTPQPEGWKPTADGLENRDVLKAAQAKFDELMG